MGILNLVTLPLRMGVAYAEASIGLAGLLAPGGPIRLVYRLADLTDEDRPLGAALAPGGTVDRLVAEGGVLVALTDVSGPVGRLLAPGGPLDRLVQEDGPLDRALEEGGVIDSLAGRGGVVDQLVRVSEQLAAVVPMVDGLEEPARRLGDAAGALNAAVRPLTSSVEALGGMVAGLPGWGRVPRVAGRMGRAPGGERMRGAAEAAEQ